MNESINAPLGNLSTGLQKLRRNWGWMLVMGILLVVLGFIALVDSVSVSLISMLFFGGVLIIAGILESIQAYRHRGSGWVWLHGFNAVLSLVIGIILVLNPVAGLIVVTFVLGIYFTIAGIFRIVASSALRIPGWGWSLANGIVTLVLGILIWAHWPVSALWVVGLFIGIDLVILGWSEVMLAMAVRRLAV